MFRQIDSADKKIGRQSRKKDRQIEEAEIKIDRYIEQRERQINFEIDEILLDPRTQDMQISR